MIIIKFNIDDYQGKYVMHCKTKEEASDFCEYLDTAGRKWCNDIRYSKRNNWCFHGDLTCYDFNKGTLCSVDVYKRYSYTILEWSDFMSDNKKFTKADLKSGDVVLRRDGSVEIICLETGTLIRKDGFDLISETTDDLRYIYHSFDNSDLNDDIIAVRRPKRSSDCQFCAFDEGLGQLVYEREDEPEEMTLEEICKALGKEIKIVKEH